VTLDQFIVNQRFAEKEYVRDILHRRSIKIFFAQAYEKYIYETYFKSMLFGDNDDFLLVE